MLSIPEEFMRNVLFILLLMLTLVACSSKKKAVDAVGTPATEESAQGEAGAPANGDEPVTIGAMENPVGEVRMVDVVQTQCNGCILYVYSWYAQWPIFDNCRPDPAR